MLWVWSGETVERVQVISLRKSANRGALIKKGVTIKLYYNLKK